MIHDYDWIDHSRLASAEPIRSNGSNRSVRPLLIALTLAGSTLLSACAPLFLGGTAVTAAVVASDRRTAGEQLEDRVIEMKIASDVRNLFPKDARINSTAYAGVVLLTGDVPTQAEQQRAEQAVSQVEKVQRVVNRLRVGETTPFSVRSNDTWLTSKVRTTLIDTREVPSSTIVITTERGTVYLMGRVTRDEAERAARAAANVNGVNQVVTLFDVTTRERIASASPASNSGAAPAASATPPSSPAASSSSVQTMPVQ